MRRNIVRFAAAAATALGLFAMAAAAEVDDATANECGPILNTLSNGNPDTTDGAVRVRVDGLGAFGHAIVGGAIFNPAGAAGAAETVSSSNLYVSFSPADKFLQDCRAGNKAEEVSRSATSLVTRAKVRTLRLDLTQQLGPISGGASTLTQAYRFTNAGESSVPLTLVRHLDADLNFDWTLLDGGAGSVDGALLHVLDSTASSSSLGIAGALDGAETPDRWTLQKFDYRDEIRFADGIPSSDDGVVHNDGNGDRVVDTPYNVTLSQQWAVASLAPGASLTLVTETQFGREPKNVAPQAVADSLTTAEDTASTIDLLANDTDPDGDPISLVGTSGGAHGSVSCAGGLCTYTPAPNFNGSDSFTYTIADGRGGSSSATVNVTVIPVDEPRQLLTVTKVGNARITSSPPGIDCGEICSAEFEVGTVVTLIATPDPGWNFSGWEGACQGTAGCVITVDAGKSVTASFALPPPTPAQTVNAVPVQGDVLVRVPGSPQYVPLPTPRQVPVGSQFDATRGRVELTAARAGGITDTSVFYDGAFQLTQQGPTAFAELRLLQGDFSVCSLPSLQTADRNRRPVRRLWGSGKGRYRTRGRFSSATVRGTIWKTEDRCDGTLTQVREGSVNVRDFGRKKDVVVRAGKSYLAEPLPPGVAALGCTIVGTSKRDVIRGTRRRDVICGVGGNDVIYGLGGNDRIYGNDGNDRLIGGRGNDLLDGGDGRDRLNGGDGADVLRGGRGADFVVSPGKTDTVRGP